MAGIYLHIPFCKQKCHYCNFHFSTTFERYRREMLDALQQELLMEAKEEMIETIYFGGGTPSLLTINELSTLLQTIEQHYNVVPHAEITIEVNPDDVQDVRHLQLWKELGINRISLGVQSFLKEDLKNMNRAHSTEQAMNAITMIKEAGIENYSIDLMFGLPGQSNEKWKENLQQLLSIKPPHVSCYNLTLEEQSALIKLIEKGKVQALKESDAASQFEITRDLLEKTGYLHYEISNYALAGHESKHNSAYWESKNYIGIGPSAHSYWNGKRQINVANNSLYIKGIQIGEPDRTKEELNREETLNEFVLTRLRTAKGIPEQLLFEKFPWAKAHLTENAKALEEKGWLVKKDHWVLSKEGKLFADLAAVELFVETED